MQQISSCPARRDGHRNRSTSPWRGLGLAAVTAIAGLAAGIAPALAVAAPYLVRDIDTTGEPFYPVCPVATCPPATPIYGALIGQPTPFEGGLAFIADDRIHGREPWLTDGTAEGTRLLADFVAGDGDSATYLLGALGEKVVLWVLAGETRGLWVADGATGSLRQLEVPCQPCTLHGLKAVAVFAGELYFELTGPSVSQRPVFRTDGNRVERVFDPCLDATGCISAVRWSQVANGALYLGANFIGHPMVGYRVDAAGNAVPAEVGCGAGRPLAAVGDELWFAGTCMTPERDSTAGVWRTSNPIAEPTLIRSFGSWGRGEIGISALEHPDRLVALGDRAAFLVGNELWWTDGTAEGTEPLDMEWVRQLGSTGDRVLVGGRRAGVEGLWSVDATGAFTELLVPAVVTRIDAIDGMAYVDAETPELGREPWLSDGTPAGTSLLADLGPLGESSRPGLYTSGNGFVRSGELVYFEADDGEHDVELWAVEAVQTNAPEPPDPEPPACAGAPHALCLHGGRFRVGVAWRDFQGNQGVGTAIPQTTETGSFWFFSPGNYELTVKVLDARSYNGAFWVFHGALTNVEYDLTVIDTQTGAVWRHQNPSGHFGSGADTAAFPAVP